jgi:hypothetical protein
MISSVAYRYVQVQGTYPSRVGPTGTRTLKHGPIYCSDGRQFHSIRARGFGNEEVGQVRVLVYIFWKARRNRHHCSRYPTIESLTHSLTCAAPETA